MSATTVTLQAPDISCGHCVKSVQDRVSALEGVDTVSASAETKLVEINFNTEVISLAKIKEELADEGYPATEA